MDTLRAGDGNDDAIGGYDVDKVYGGDGDDAVLTGGESDGPGVGDDAYGGAGNDSVIGDVGHNILYGGTGEDVLLSRGAVCRYSECSGALEYMYGGQGDDYLKGGPMLQSVFAGQIFDGGRGNDVLDGRLNDDAIRLGSEPYLADVASYAHALGPMTVDLTQETASGDGADVLLGMESVEGGAF
jgi:Ca2+-binding RTX toxin-like protein